MYAYENEYVRYKPEYAETFCTKAYNKKSKIYKPLFKVAQQYYEMSFGREQGDRFYSYVSCCKTGETIYDFANGDLLLSDVIELIMHHAKIHEYTGPHDLSILTCNTPCSGKVPDVGTYLHRSTSYEPGLDPPNYNWNTTRKRSQVRRKKNMVRLPNSRRIRSHFPKSGNIMMNKETYEKIRVPPNATEDYRHAIKKTHFFIPNLQEGDFVYYYGETYVIDQIQEENKIIYYEIRNTLTGYSTWVDAREVLKIEY
jgi:hypothetical protein